MKRGRSWVVVVALALAGCSSDDDPGPKTAAIEPLDPAGTHFGKTYGEWGAAWWAWVLGVQGCDQAPLDDPTGRHCLVDQDAPVFFLAGSQGFTVVRELCPVPADKPLFFPILNLKSDNVAEDPRPMEEHCAAMEIAREAINPADLFLYVDGSRLSGLEVYWAGPTTFTYEVPPPPNKYSCGGIDGIQGTIEACTGGYYVLLPPLGPGPHEVRFGGRVEAAQFEIDTTYRWVAE